MVVGSPEEGGQVFKPFAVEFLETSAANVFHDIKKYMGVLSLIKENLFSNEKLLLESARVLMGFCKHGNSFQSLEQ